MTNVGAISEWAGIASEEVKAGAFNAEPPNSGTSKEQ